MNREIFPGGIYPLQGDVQSQAGQQNVVVIGIQNIPIKSGTPDDGQVLTFDQTNKDWEAKDIPGTRSVLVNSVSVSDDFFATVNYDNGFPPPVMGVSTFKWADMLPGIVVNASGTWVVET